MSQSYNQPRAVVHRNILDVAAAEPDASIEGIARRVTGATVPLVERVLEDYGDPADEPTDDEPDDVEVDSDDTPVDDVEVEPEDTDVTEAAGLASTDVEESPEDHTTEQAPVEQQPDAESDADVQPVEDDSQATATGDAESSVQQMTIDRADISDAQFETLQVIAEQPEASQRDIAAVLDISQSTVNNRLNSIEGFEWTARSRFAGQLVEADGGVEPITHTADTQEPELDQSEVLVRLERLERQLDALTDARDVAFDDPDLARSVLRACFESDAVSEDQEREVVASLMATTQQSD